MSNMIFDLDASLEAQRTRQNAEGCVKTWEDLERYRAAITAADPTLIIECGTYSGQSARWFAKHSNAHVITIDVGDYVADEVKDEWGERVHFILGSSADPEIVQAVRDLACDHERVMVVLDSDHSAPHVLAELDAYAPLVTAGSFCVVEDTIVRWLPHEMRPDGPYDGSPYDAVDQWLPHHPEWTVDVNIDAMYAQAQHPGGWLRRLG